MTKPDYRALCARMADELDEYRQLLLDDRSVTHRLADEARAALAEPEPAGQTPPDYIDPEHTGADRELLQAFYAACQSEGGTVDEVTLRGLRAAIAADRAQRHPVPPEPGEVQELVEWLRELGAKRGGVFDVSTFCANLTRAAELLSQRHPQPVPVSERLPGPEDCDEEGSNV